VHTELKTDILFKSCSNLKKKFVFLKACEGTVVLGEDVLSMTVGPPADADRLLLVGPVLMCGLLTPAASSSGIQHSGVFPSPRTHYHQ
jgi:hypothetical protein